MSGWFYMGVEVCVESMEEQSDSQHWLAQVKEGVATENVTATGQKCCLCPPGAEVVISRMIRSVLPE